MHSVPEKKLADTAIQAWRLSLLLISLAVVVVPLIVWMFSVWFSGDSLWGWGGLFLISLIIMVLAVFFIPEIRWRHWYYQVDPHEIDLQSGILIVTRTLVPVKRVQHVDTRQGPILRSYGLADVTISTAATTHRIPALKEETANAVRDQISKFARMAKEDV